MVSVKENISLASYTVFKIGGPARYFCEVQNKEELTEALDFARSKKVPFFMLGAGSNVLVADSGFPGLVIKMGLQRLEVGGERLVVGSGVSMARAVNFAIENNFGGFEWGIGIPGTIGGSVFGNSGCFGGEMKDLVNCVEIFDGSAVRALQNKECEFSYRHSIFKEKPNWVILSAQLQFNMDAAKSRERIAQISKARITATSDPVSREFFNPEGHVAPQDVGVLAAGCIFKNVLWTRKDIDKKFLFSNFPKFKAFDGNPGLPAGFLIEGVGLKGKKIGGAMVSKKHANYILNTDGATAADVKNLIELVKSEVQKAHGIALEEEIGFI